MKNDNYKLTLKHTCNWLYKISDIMFTGWSSVYNTVNTVIGKIMYYVTAI